MLSWELQHSITMVFLCITCSNQAAELEGRITSLGSHCIKHVDLTALIVTWLQYGDGQSPFHSKLDGHKQICSKTHIISSKLFLKLLLKIAVNL